MKKRDWIQTNLRNNTVFYQIQPKEATYNVYQGEVAEFKSTQIQGCQPIKQPEIVEVLIVTT
jgi:hypothetical protein